MSEDRGIKLSIHAKERLKERFGLVTDNNLMNKIRRESKLINIINGEEIREVSYNGTKIQYIVAHVVISSEIIKTFIPDTYVAIDPKLLVTEKLSIKKRLMNEIESKDIAYYDLKKQFTSAEKSIVSLGKQLKNSEKQRKEFFNKSFIKSYKLFIKHRKGYLTGTKSKKI